MRYRNGQVSELAAWKILECLARAAMVLEEGTEDPNVEVAHEQVAHFDIKPQNSKLVPSPSTDQVHSKLTE